MGAKAPTNVVLGVTRTVSGRPTRRSRASLTGDGKTPSAIQSYRSTLAKHPEEPATTNSDSIEKKTIAVSSPALVVSTNANTNKRDANTDTAKKEGTEKRVTSELAVPESSAKRLSSHRKLEVVPERTAVQQAGEQKQAKVRKIFGDEVVNGVADPTVSVVDSPKRGIQSPPVTFLKSVPMEMRDSTRRVRFVIPTMLDANSGRPLTHQQLLPFTFVHGIILVYDALDHDSLAFLEGWWKVNSLSPMLSVCSSQFFSG